LNGWRRRNFLATSNETKPFFSTSYDLKAARSSFLLHTTVELLYYKRSHAKEKPRDTCEIYWKSLKFIEYDADRQFTS